MFSAQKLGKKQRSGQRQNNKAQVMLEFTFCFVIVVIFIMACFSAFIWGGRVLAQRQKAFEGILTSGSSWDSVYQPESMVLIPNISREPPMGHIKE